MNNILSFINNIDNIYKMSLNITTQLQNSSNQSISSGLNSKLNYMIYGIMIGSMVVILMTSGSQGENATYAYMNGYIALLSSIIFMFSLIWYRSSDVSIYRLSISLFPFIMLMVIIVWLLVYLFKYFDRITTNKVSDYYGSFMNTSTMLTLVQLIMLVNAVTDKNFEKNRSIQPKIFSILMLLGTINIIVVVTLGVILKSYVTDC